MIPAFLEMRDAAMKSISSEDYSTTHVHEKDPWFILLLLSSNAASLAQSLQPSRQHTGYALASITEPPNFRYAELNNAIAELIAVDLSRTASLKRSACLSGFLFLTLAMPMAVKDPESV